jgi:hypothetical protein
MKPMAMLTPCACLIVLSACAGDLRQTASDPLEGSISTQQALANLRFHYRQHAVDLRDMAKRRQIEADVLAQQVGPDDAQVRRKRDLAEDLLSAADEAETKAREIRRQMPHNMMQ